MQQDSLQNENIKVGILEISFSTLSVFFSNLYRGLLISLFAMIRVFRMLQGPRVVIHTRYSTKLKQKLKNVLVKQQVSLLFVQVYVFLLHLIRQNPRMLDSKVSLQ